MSETSAYLHIPNVDDLLAAERARIARELHDVVTHSVSVMVLQAGAAREIMRQDERRSRALLESVEASGRRALEELRRLLGLVSDQDADAPLSAQPGVSEIPALIEHVREAGVTIELCVEGQPRAISGRVAVAAYRIVQEALTNVLKHAGGAPSRVILRWSDGALELEIVDHGPPQNHARRDAPAGRGLAGMRERAATLGGTLQAHPGLDVGYVVRARIPLDTVGTRADERQSPTTTRSWAALRTTFDAPDGIELVTEAASEPGREPPLRPAADPEQNQPEARSRPTRWLSVRGISSWRSRGRRHLPAPQLARAETM